MVQPVDLQQEERPSPGIPSYDGRLFGPLEPTAGSVVGHYHQHDDTVWADFAGGPVRTGRLVGVRDATGVIEAAYCQIMTTGEVVAGRCLSTPTVLGDGRVRLTEQWRRADGSSGVSVIQELPPSPFGLTAATPDGSTSTSSGVPE